MSSLPFRPASAIRFESEIRPDPFYARLRERAAAWFQDRGCSPYGNRETLIKGLIYSLILVGSYTALLTVKGSLLLSYGFWLLYGLAALFVVYNVSHDAAHDALTPWPRFNAAVYLLTFNLLGVSAYLWKLRHLHSHHLFPNLNGCDADIDANPFVRLSPNHPRRWYMRWQHVYAHFLYPWVNLHSLTWNDWLYLRTKHLANMRDLKHPPSEWLIFVAAKILFALLSLLLPAWMLALNALEALGGFVLMNAGISMAFVYMNIVNHFSAASHFPEVVNRSVGHSWAAHQLATTVDYCPESRWANWLTGGFNAHAAHHLFPQVCHVHYPALSRIIRQTAAEFGLPYTAVSFWQALRLHQRLLYNLGRWDDPPEGPHRSLLRPQVPTSESVSPPTALQALESL